MAGFIHGARASDSRTLHDGINTGWAGANSNAAVSNVAGSQETVLTVSGGLGEAETAGAMLNIIPRDGGNQFSGTMFVSGASGGMQGSNYTDDLRAAGLRSPAELKKVYDFNPMGGGRIIRDKLWFYLTYREVVAENTIPGIFFNRNAGDPTKWLVDFDTSRPSLRGQRDPKCDRATHLAGLTAQQSEFQPLPAVRQTEQGRRRHRDANTRSAGPETLHAWVHSDSDVGITHHQPVAGRGRLGQLLLRLRQPGATGRWHAQPRSDLDPRAVLRRLPEQRRHRRADLSLQPPAAAGIRAPSDRHDRSDARGALVHPGLAQPEVRLSRQRQSPEPGRTSTRRRSFSTGSTTAFQTS